MLSFIYSFLALTNSLRKSLHLKLKKKLSDIILFKIDTVNLFRLNIAEHKHVRFM